MNSAVRVTGAWGFKPVRVTSAGPVPKSARKAPAVVLTIAMVAAVVVAFHFTVPRPGLWTVVLFCATMALVYAGSRFTYCSEWVWYGVLALAAWGGVFALVNVVQAW